MKVLIAEDDPKILAGLAEVLGREGYTCLCAADGELALQAFRTGAPDFVILDIMMPRVSGYDVCRTIRAQDAEIPILFLSAKSEEIDKVVGLELGADDYIHKPFGVHEVIARIRAISRRCLRKRPGPRPQGFTIGDLSVIPDELRALRGDVVIDLSLREVQLLRLFADNLGAVLDRDKIFAACWGIDTYPNSRTIDQHVAKLRKKVEPDPRNPTIIRTVHGVGYRYEG
ncbi:MAG: response regulator transcription factor [Nannocystaceae bacterium]